MDKGTGSFAGRLGNVGSIVGRMAGTSRLDLRSRGLRMFGALATLCLRPRELPPVNPEEIRAFYDDLWSRESPETNRHERARFAEIFALAAGLRRPAPEILDAGCG